MAGTPAAFQGDADGATLSGFQNDAFQTGEAAAADTTRLLTMLGVGFEWLFVILWLATSHTHS